MNYLKTKLRKKPPPVAVLLWEFGNPLRNNQVGSKYISCATNDLLDTVAGASFNRSLDYQDSARGIQIIGSLVNIIKPNLPQAQQDIFSKQMNAKYSNCIFDSRVVNSMIKR